MKRASILLCIGVFFLPACASARLSQDEARRRIAAIGQSSLVPDAIEIRRIVSQSDTSAIAESTVTLAFQFKRATPDAEWRIEAVRLGDRDWVSFDELLAAIHEGRRRETEKAMLQLVDGIEKYRAANGALPAVGDIVQLTDTLYPRFMNVLIREDGWGKPILYQVAGSSTYRLISPGPDGVLKTTDDVMVEKGPASP
jgi:hypothetical protein